MNSLLRNIYDTGFVEDREGNLICPFPEGIPQETGLILYELIHKEKLERTLEVGMAYGLSTLFMCQAHHDKNTGSHAAIDPWQKTIFKSIGLLNLERACLQDLFHLFEAPSYEILPQLLKQDQQFDFVFIDGIHLFDYALVDFFYTDKLLSIGGYVAFDDIWMPSIRKLLYFILKNMSYRLVRFPSRLRWWNKTKIIAQRLLNEPLEKDYQRIKWIPENICVLKKMSEDNRDWKFYRSF